MRDGHGGVVIGSEISGGARADFYYEEGDTGAFTPVLRDVEVRNVTSRKSKYAFFLKGDERSPLSDIRVTDCTFEGVENADVLQSVRNLTVSNVRVNGRLRNESISK